MNTILSKKQLSEKVFLFEVAAPEIARAHRAGHFVILRVDENSERMPLTIASSDAVKGIVTIVVQEVGVSSSKLARLNVGDKIHDLVGPLGKATHIENFGTVVCAGGGVGIAPMLPIATALKKAGNRVVAVLAGRNKDLIILQDEMSKVADEVVIMTDDGSAGKQGLVTQGIEDVIQREKVDKCFAIGPAIMMKFVCVLTRKYGISTDVSLNTIMVDGTGMCGACRVTVGGQTKFVCVDGPEFDGHEVDFDEMMSRLRGFKPEEIAAYESYKQTDVAEEDDSRDSAWRVELRKSMKPTERTQIPRVKMSELNAQVRARELRKEVNLGLTKEEAMTEAKRCLDCNNPGCVTGCPVGIDIPRFIKHLEKGEIDVASAVIRETSSLPAVCGRVCPQEKQCESKCIHHKMKSEPVAIGYLERFVADNAAPLSASAKEAEGLQTERPRIAVIGSGPAGLSFAGEMCNHGYDITIFEALHELGGVLRYGIPEYRLPNNIIDTEIENLEKRGVTFVRNCIVGKTITLEELTKQGFVGVFAGTGAGLPRFMGIEGENLNNILSSNEYLTRVNLMDASSDQSDTPLPLGKHVIVVGGGNTAMDSVRTALRLGAESASIVYRRSENEMPARIEEVRHAKEEGVEFLTLHNPIKYESDEQGRVCAVLLQQMELGEPDESGRRSPQPIPGAIVRKEVDLVIVAIGVSPNPIFTHTVENLSLGRKGTIDVNEQLESSVPMLFAGGDIVRGGATVILAMGDGKNAAKAMAAKLKSAK
ncbi:MAG: bifunctional dihydroorotate dehydrogenase B NAD binding subunit/NADPH-dependent glutamate synthase [Alloprevotella sp.]|nr:bifunctional dihydroorotate dehydrogenase B NAD binding subunit/NADPH-dependent glutamate synthase [Alloprevotella sp.]